MEHSSAGVMLEEVELETERVWNFVIEREIEAPDRFRAIQSYRYAAYLLGILPRLNADVLGTPKCAEVRYWSCDQLQFGTVSCVPGSGLKVLLANFIPKRGYQIR